MAWSIIYVNPSTGSDASSDPSNIATPYKTWKKACDNLNPGGIILLRGGTYTMASTDCRGLPSGTAGNPTRVQAYALEPAIFQPATTQTHLNYFSEQNYLSFTDIEMDGNNTITSHNVRMDECAHITFTNCDLHHANLQIYLGERNVGLPGCDDVVMTNCKLRNTNDVASGSLAVYVHGCTNFVLQNSDIYDIAYFGLQSYGTTQASTGPNTGMILRNNRWWDFSMDTDTIAHRNKSAIIICQGDAQIYQNIFIGASHAYAGSAILIQNFGAGGAPVNCTVYHNAIHEWNQYGVLIDAGTGHSVRNNIINDVTTPISIAAGTGTAANNLTAGTDTDIWEAPTGSKPDRDYHLKSGSIAIDGGSAEIASITPVGIDFDFEGNIRVQNTVVDAGPYEFRAYIWTVDAQNPGGGWGDSSFTVGSIRSLIEGDDILSAETSIKLVLRGRTTGSYTLQHVSICNRDGATLDSSDGSLTQVTFGDTWANGVTVSAGETILSDAITFTTAVGQDLFVTAFYTASMGAYFTGTGATSSWVIFTTDNSQTKDWGALTPDSSNAHVYNLARIEVSTAPVSASSPVLVVQPTYIVVPGTEQALNPTAQDQDSDIELITLLASDTIMNVTRSGSATVDIYTGA